MSRGERAYAQKKVDYFARLVSLLEEYPTIILATADNVGSNHFQKIRLSLRGKAIILMGKNTMMRKALRQICVDKPEYEAMIPYFRGNVGMIFTKDDVSQIKKTVEGNTVPAMAKAGAVAPVDVFIPSGNTGLDPSQTAFFQALNIPTKINKGQIEITSQVHVIKADEKVGPSEAALCAKMGIKPFTYGLIVVGVFDDGCMFDPAVLDLSDDDLVQMFRNGVANVTAVALKLHMPTVSSVPHSIINGIKNCAAISAATDYTPQFMEKVKEYLADPSKFAVAAPAAAAPTAAASAPAAAAAAPEEEEEEEDMGLDLFD